MEHGVHGVDGAVVRSAGRPIRRLVIKKSSAPSIGWPSSCATYFLQGDLVVILAVCVGGAEGRGKG